MESDEAFHLRLRDWIGEVVIVDCVSPYVAVGTLRAVGRDFLELESADMHDLRDSSTSRENYLVKTARLGVQANRSLVIFRLAEAVAVSKLSEIVGA